MVIFPKVLRIEPASKCNLGCVHCPTGTIEMERGIMSLDIFQKILIEIKENKENIKVIVLYHGGEPFLNKNFFKMVKEIKEINNNFYIKTVSNGTVLNEKIIDQIVSSDIDLIEFSLDGYSSEDSEKIRKNSNTNKIIENLKKILEKKKKLKKKLKLQICNTQFILDKKNSVLPNTPDWILEIFKNEDVTYKNFFAMQWPAMYEKELNEFDKILIDEDDKNYCDHVVNTITIRSDGSIVPCCYDLTTQLHMGNIMNDSLKNIWNNSNYTKLRDSIKSKKYISICKNCNVVRSPVYLVPKKNFL
jgi:radical SAM protein with 4Fe4S-binding SPASM domain